MSGSTEETEEDLGTAEELLSTDDEDSDNDPLRQESIHTLYRVTGLALRHFRLLL